MTYASEVLADSPTIYLKLDEASGTTAADSSGNGNNFTYGAAAVLGQTGLFSGSGTSVQISGTSANLADLASIPTGLSNPTNFTLETWVDLPSASLSDGLVEIGQSGSNGYGMGLGWGPGGNYASIGNYLIGAGAGSGWCDSGSPMGTGTHHIAITRDASHWNFYIDGSLVKSNGALGFSAATTACSIGGWVPGWRNLNGVRMQHAAVYTTTLSATRIAAHYAAATGSSAVPRGTFREPAAFRRQAVVRASSY